jgi:transposase
LVWRDGKAMQKKDYLMENGTYNKNHNNVKSPKFLGDYFFDPMDIAQVKYEMLKEVEKNGMTITDATDNYGFSRTSYYNIKEAFSNHGIKGLLPEKPGPKNPHKLTQEVQKRIDEYIAQKPRISSSEITELINQDGVIHINKRTVERYRAKKKP